MYLLYEHHKDSDGVLLATDMLLSSFYPGKPGVNFKRVEDNILFLSIKDKIFKSRSIPISQRNYDPDTHIWTFFSGTGAGVYKTIKDSKLLDLGLKIQKVEKLAEQVKARYISKPIVEIFDPSDFFYAPAAPVPSGPSKEQAASQLATIFGVPEAEITRKLYLKAALRLHPDRNSGDASGMTELNFLWQVYNA